MKAVLVGHPNVGKSLVLHRLTGARTVVSNYHGTSIDLTYGTVRSGDAEIELIDTPGTYSLSHASAEERMTAEQVKAEETSLIINVVDGADLARNLALTLEVLEVGRPAVVLINQLDRARAVGTRIDYDLLARILGCPVFPISATTGEGIDQVLAFLKEGARRGRFASPVSTREREADVINLDRSFCSGECSRCSRAGDHCLDQEMWSLHERARLIAARVTHNEDRKKGDWLSRVEKAVDAPVTGTALLLALAYLGFKSLVWFVAWAEGTVGAAFSPVQGLLEKAIVQVLPHGFVAHVLSRAVPEGLLVPFALVMPAMLLVSLLMALLEDTGLLPRYAVALERLGSVFGVSGQAFIPLSLGFGCRTPAVIATRVLPSANERFVVIALLSIVIPCAATIGILTSVIAAFHAQAGIIVLTMVAVFLFLGMGLKRLFGHKSDLLYELPPLRLPMATNLWSKVKVRFGGFFTEVLPLLLVMSIAVRAIIESGVLARLNGWEPFTRALFGIPAEAFIAVLITIVQRYLAPLVLLNLQLTPREATIAITMIALSMPCLPVMVMTVKEAGLKVLGRVIALGLTVSFSTGVILNLILPH